MDGRFNKITREALNLQLEVTKQMVTLAGNGLGLVAALAWNSVIQELVSNYVKPFLPAGYGIVSLLIYALLITILAVTVTLQMTKLKNSLEKALSNSSGEDQKNENPV